MPNLNDVVKDPDFWGDQTSDADRKWTLSQVDKKFAGYGEAEQDRFIKNLNDNRQRNQQMQDKQHEERAAQVLPKIQESQQKKTMWEQAVAPLTQAVGRGVEVATEPLVGLSRMMNGEGASAAFGPETFSASHPPTANQVASNVVPQSPWQAGAMGAQFIPGLGAAGSAARLGPAATRVGAAALGGGALQGLLGSEGLLEGNTNAVGEALTGAAKGGATQAAGEGIGKLLGGATRIPGTGRAARIERGDSRNIQKAIGDIAPELAGQGKSVAKAGEFFTGTQGAKQAAGGAYEQGINKLEQELVRTTGSPYINTPELVDAFKRLAALAKNEPGLSGQIQQLAPNGTAGFLPSQVAKIVSLTGERLKAGQTGMGHLKDAAMDDLVQSVENSVPAGAKGILTATRAGYAKSAGLRELLKSAYTPGRKGYQFDMRKVQQALSTNPDLANRLSPSELQQLMSAATRGASNKPGLMDLGAGNIANVPGSPSKFSLAAAALRNLLRSGKHVGELPGTLPQGAKAGLGVATTATAGRKSRDED